MVFELFWMCFLVGFVSCGLSMICLVLQVRLTMEEPEPGLTVVKLNHVDVPEEDRLVPSFRLMVFGILA